VGTDLRQQPCDEPQCTVMRLPDDANWNTLHHHSHSDVHASAAAAAAAGGGAGGGAGGAAAAGHGYGGECVDSGGGRVVDEGWRGGGGDAGPGHGSPDASARRGV